MGRITDGASARLIGAHTVDNGGIHMAARRAGAADMRALQIFTAIPKYYGDKSSIRPERVTRFRETLVQVGILPEHVVVHAAYVLNTATTDEEKWGRASAGLRKELERSSSNTSRSWLPLMRARAEPTAQGISTLDARVFTAARLSVLRISWTASLRNSANSSSYASRSSAGDDPISGCQSSKSHRWVSLGLSGRSLSPA